MVDQTAKGDESTASEAGEGGDNFPGDVSMTYTNYAAPSAVFQEGAPPIPETDEYWKPGSRTTTASGAPPVSSRCTSQHRQRTPSLSTLYGSNVW